MKLIGNLKEQVATGTNKEKAKEVIAKAGRMLDDTELNQVVGGNGEESNGFFSLLFE